MKVFFKYRYLVARRTTQMLLLGLFFAGNQYGLTIFRGNYSTALLFGTIPMSDPFAVLQIFVSGIVVNSDLLIGSLIVLAFYGFFFGRVFCSWICPVNIIADAAIWLNQRFGLNTSLMLSRKIRYGFLVISLILSPILSYAAFEAISPVSMVYRAVIFGFGTVWTVILAIFLFDVAVTKYGWCGHLCPLGAFYSITGRFSLLKVKHNKENCTSCMKCFKACHEVQVLDIVTRKNGYIKSGECTNCGRCIEVCDDNALGFSLRNPYKTFKNIEK